MSSVKRNLALIAAVAGLTFSAGSAQAASAIDFIWTSNSTPTIASPAASSTVTGALVLTGGDTPGPWLIVFTVDYDTVELDFADALEFVTPQLEAGMANVGNVLSPITSGVAVNEGTGRINQLDWSGNFSFANGCIPGCVVTLGTIKFRVTAAAGDGMDRDIRLGEFSTGLDGTFNQAGGDVVVNYNDAAVLPEPLSGAFGVAALGALALLARRRS